MAYNFICPFCYEGFNRSQIEFRCENNQSTSCRENDVKLAAYFGGSTLTAGRVIPVKNKSFGGLFNKMTRIVSVPEQTRCDQCNYPSRKKICPHCHNELPSLFHQADSHIISVIGARDSGKTHYITVLINELLQKGHTLDIQTVPQDVGEDRAQITSKRYSEYYKKPLLGRKEQLGQTQQNAKDLYPLIYQISSGQKQFGKTKALYLVFYDTAGENFNDKEELKKLANYLINSSGIIFLLDTFRISRINETLTKKGVGITNVDTSFRDVFGQMHQLLQQFGKIKLNAKSDVPVALTFSKIDEVINNNLLEDDIQEFTLRKESSYLRTRLYDDDEIKEIGNDMRSLLAQWGEEGFIADVERSFSKTGYFGVSALGSTPIGGMLKGEVRPHRVMDPLLWILDKLDFALPKKAKK